MSDEDASPDPAPDPAALAAFLDREFPQVADDYTVEVDADGLVVGLVAAARHLRPGGTVSGPTLFALADVAFYLAVIAAVGPKPLAVTTSASIDFMRKAEPGRRVRARPRLLKVGRLLVVGDVVVEADGLPGPVARAALTYALPPEKP